MKMAQLTAEQERTRAEVAAYLREFANQLDTSTTDESDAEGDSAEELRRDDAAAQLRDTDGEPTSRTEETDSTAENRRDRDTTAGENVHHGEKVTLIVGNESATLNPPERVTFKIDINADSSLIGAGEEQSAQFELRWSGENVPEDDELSIQ